MGVSRHPVRAAACATALLAAVHQPVRAEPAPGGSRTIAATAQDLLRLAETFVLNGQAERAAPILDLLARDPNADVRNEARYRRSLLLEAQGRDSAAAVLLRQILDDRPDAAAVRLKLATTLQKLGDEDSALRELRALRSSDLPPEAARFVDRLSASLQATKPLGFQVELALAPDSNINRATRSGTLGTVFGDFELDQEARSGVGAALRGLGQARVPLGGRLNLVGRAGGHANLYRDPDFNDLSLDVATGVEMGLGRTRLGAELGAGQQWYGMKPYQRGFRVAGNVAQPVGPVTQVRVDAAVRWTDNRLNNLQDGSGLSAVVRAERALSPNLMVSAFVGVDRFKARDDAYSTRAWNAGLTAYRVMGRMTLIAGAEIGRLSADDRLALLPERREDKISRLHLGGVFRQATVAGFAPMARLVVERNRSSVEFYDYRRTRTEFGISRAF